MRRDKEILSDWLRDDSNLREEVNKIELSASLSGQRIYSRVNVQETQGELDVLEESGKPFEAENDPRKLIAKKIFEATKSCTESAKLKFQDPDAASLIDTVAFKLFSYTEDLNDIARGIELAIAPCLQINHGIKYDSYQMGVSFYAKGMLTETYLLEVNFVPEPKKLGKFSHTLPL